MFKYIDEQAEQLEKIKNFMKHYPLKGKQLYEIKKIKRMVTNKEQKEEAEALLKSLEWDKLPFITYEIPIESKVFSKLYTLHILVAEPVEPEGYIMNRKGEISWCKRQWLEGVVEIDPETLFTLEEAGKRLAEEAKKIEREESINE